MQTEDARYIDVGLSYGRVVTLHGETAMKPVVALHNVMVQRCRAL